MRFLKKERTEFSDLLGPNICKYYHSVSTESPVLSGLLTYIVFCEGVLVLVLEMRGLVVFRMRDFAKWVEGGGGVYVVVIDYN